MRGSTVLLITILLAPSPSSAFVVQDNYLTYFNACLNYATAHGGHVSRSGETISFICAGNVAKSFYDLLGENGVVTDTVKQKGGVFRRRTLKGGQCAQKIEDAEGTSTNSFVCNLYMKM